MTSNFLYAAGFVLGTGAVGVGLTRIMFPGPRFRIGGRHELSRADREEVERLEAGFLPTSEPDDIEPVPAPEPQWWERPVPTDEATPVFDTTGSLPVLDEEFLDGLSATNSWNRDALLERVRRYGQAQARQAEPAVRASADLTARIADHDAGMNAAKQKRSVA